MRAPPAGRPAQGTAGTNPRTGQASRYVFNLDFDGHVSEVRPTSRPKASRRSVCKAPLRTVGGRISMVFAPLVRPILYDRWYRSTVSSGFFVYSFSRGAVVVPCLLPLSGVLSSVDLGQWS